MTYRSDIDGLRALAVVSVVLYHANVPLFSGGFVGVDVFFVISGFLITNIIVSDIAAANFSLARFYERRIRRIFPALLLVLVFCVVAGWLVMAPSDYRRLAGSVAATALFSSNLYCWSQTGYFDTPASEKPLLHTWSLAVEEQFYVLFPLYLVALSTWMPRRRLAITLAFCIVSFLLCAVAVFIKPGATFYLAPARAWELLIGSLLALGVVAESTRAVRRDASALAGLAMIVAAILLYDHGTPYPGLSALLPTLGTALIISTERTALSAVLSHPALVFVGKISYSLYLWHFVLLAFGGYAKFTGLTDGERAGLVALSVVIATLSWKYVEQPARRSNRPLLRQPKLFVASGFATALICVFAVVVQFAPGAGRAGAAPASDSELTYPRCLTYAFSPDIPASCRFGGGGPPALALWGDSHADVLRPAIDEVLKERGIAGVLVGAFNCPALLGINHSQNKLCRANNESIMRLLVSDPSIRTVVLGGLWAGYAEFTEYKTTRPYDSLHVDGHSSLRGYESISAVIARNHAALETGLEMTIATLQAAGKVVLIVGPVPENGFSVPRALFIQSRGFFRDLPVGPDLAEFMLRQRFVLPLFERLAEKHGIDVVWPHLVLCVDKRCDVERDGKSLYIDSNHLSVFGARSLVATFRSALP